MIESTSPRHRPAAAAGRIEAEASVLICLAVLTTPENAPASAMI